MLPLGLLIVVLVIFFGMGSLGLCIYCKNFTDEYEHGQFEGGFKYVADQEHDSEGKPLTGTPLELSRRAEQIFNPICYPINKLLGREKAPPTKGN